MLWTVPLLLPRPSGSIRTPTRQIATGVAGRQWRSIAAIDHYRPTAVEGQASRPHRLPTAASPRKTALLRAILSAVRGRSAGLSPADLSRYLTSGPPQHRDKQSWLVGLTLVSGSTIMRSRSWMAFSAHLADGNRGLGALDGVAEGGVHDGGSKRTAEAQVGQHK